MRRHHPWARILGAAILLLLVGGGAALAQLQTGNLYGKVTDTEGAPLPGVTVTLDTGAAQLVQVTDGEGLYRFLGLPPATMKLKTELEGFSPVEYPTVVITVGHNTTVNVTMAAAITSVITVTASETPLLDERKVGTGATVSGVELREIPTSRDPWSILSTTPGVLTDRTNVGGSESGQQSTYIGPGSVQGNSVWSVDGVVITDMAALGSSPSYFDFDAFQEMQVTTGGTDTTVATAGVVVNMVTKRGTNQWRGSGRFFDTPGATESASSFSNSQLAAGQGAVQTNSISKIQDFGAEIGGPVVKDHLWVWGSYGDQKIAIVALGGATNKADVPTWNGKVNAQITPSNSATLFVLQNDKTVNGRDAGPTRPQPTTWDQGHQGSNPTAAKAEDTQIFGESFYLTGLITDVNGGFGLVPEGGLGPVTYLDSGGVWHNSFLEFVSPRPQKQGRLDASNFFNIGKVANELKYGTSYRRVETDSLSTWGPGYIVQGAAPPGSPYPNLFLANRGEDIKVRTDYTSGYAQDTLTAGNLTANLGVRYDLQQGHNLAVTAPANPVAPSLLPAFNNPGGPSGFSWSDFTPRIGLTYALGEKHQTLLRASYSRYADQLGTTLAGITNLGIGQSYYFFSTPQTGPGLPTIVAPLGPPGTNYSGNLNPATGLPIPFNAVAPGFSAPLTDEVLASVEHALLPDLVVSLNGTFRYLSNQIPTDSGATLSSTGLPATVGIPLVFDDPNPTDPATLGSVGRPAQRSDFIPETTTVTLPNGRTTTVTYYVLRPGVSTRGGTLLTNGGPSSTYKGVSLVANKRLSNHWMLRGNVTYSDWTFGSPGNLPDPTDFEPGGNRSGDAVLIQSLGSGNKSNVFINSKWSASLNGMYQVAPERPWGFNLAGNLTARQGFAIPYYVQVPLTASNYVSGLNIYPLAVAPDAFRLPDLVDFDARIEKELRFQDFGLTLSVDAFNLFNSSTVLQRQADLSLGESNFVNEILAPRVFRFGARISFR